MNWLTAGEVARELNLQARQVSDWLYQSGADRKAFPLVGRNRLIPREFLPQLAEQLRRRADRRQRAGGER